ncbi:MULTISPECIES: GRP family sugar transporter [Enterococcus]|uniref:EamA family transporter n=1 Tax=Candidatus Enterococcus murrayae TaxID=2815321 RepID=A0ABS3HHS1_9ENTE|nr:GRP family sugar transporter [Enterococcus sp. MJM16]MBO0452460.1 EamA family transporter [Enterococcus sp. MJM16]
MIILCLLPALGWGFMPIIAQLTNAKPINQLLGTTTVALLIGSLFTVIVQPNYSSGSFLAAIFSGCFWSIGQYLQFYSFQLLPVSEAMPISNGTQLIGTTFIAALFFGEWSNMKMAGIGIGGILLIIVGIIFTSYLEKQDNTSLLKTTKSKALICLLLSSLALTIYVTLPQAFQASGAEVLFPQAIGMWFLSIALSLSKRDETSWRQVKKNFGTGIAWSIANISLFLTIPLIGVAKSFTFSQLAVLISIYAGLVFLKVQKTKKEWRMISLGAALITIGILLIGSIK